MNSPLPLRLRLPAAATARPVAPFRDALLDALHEALGPRGREAVLIAADGPDWLARYRTLGHRVRTLALRGPHPPPVPVRDGVLDLLHVHGLVEQLDHPGAELAEWLRVLRPGGMLLVSGLVRPDGAAPVEGDRVFADGLHPREAATLLETAGLRAVDARRLPDPRAETTRAWWRRRARGPGETLYLAWGRVP